MEKITYQELKEKANKALTKNLLEEFKAKGIEYKPFNFSKKDISVWALLNGYTKQRIQINNIRKIYYIKH